MDTITLPVNIIDEVEKKLKAALEEVRALKRKQVKKSSRPVCFWSSAEWEKAEKEADADIKAGRVYRLNRAEDLDKSLQDLAR